MDAIIFMLLYFTVLRFLLFVNEDCFHRLILSKQNTKGKDTHLSTFQNIDLSNNL